MSRQHTLKLDHDGAPLRGQLFIPDEPLDSRPGVLIFHDAMGLSDFTLDKARLLAEMGYTALATDMYGNAAHSEIPEEAGKYFIIFHENPHLLRARAAAWFRELTALPGVDATRTAAIGYCFGGRCVLELARSGAGVKAVVSYHGLLTTHAPAEPNSLDTHVAVYTGSRDPYAPPDDVNALRKEMAESGATLHLTEFSDACHAFTNPNPPRGVDAGMQYDEVCDRVSWAGTRALLETVLA